jgi:hypothetical protein
MGKVFARLAAYQSIVCFIVYYFVALTPLFTVFSPHQAYNEPDVTLTCYFWHASIEGTTACPVTKGPYACYQIIENSGSECNAMLVAMDNVEAYTLVSATATIVVIGLLYLTAILSTSVVYVPFMEAQADAIHKITVLLHLIAAAAAIVMIHQTSAILDETKYSNSNGHGQYPNPEAASFVVVAAPLVMLAIDNIPIFTQ